MKFAQLIEFRTNQIDTFNANLDAWKIKTEGRRIPHVAVLRRDRERENTYLFLVEFASQEAAMENSGNPEVGEFVAALTAICEGPLTYRSLDVLREEDL
jgi:quinol monooxygenase YgiN